ncbi:MAG TPA: hypothetical protein VMU87_05255 [Stellaceae bacterium]|nr:hypothetical protein [Stellaceae bacterium]
MAGALTLGGCGYSNNIFWETAAPPPPAKAAILAAAAPEAASARKPFVVIRFERADPDYRTALYDALHGALERRPDVEFDVVAVTRDTTAAQRDLASVVHSLAAMGMPSERISLSSVAASDDATDEVRIYLR